MKHRSQLSPESYKKFRDQEKIKHERALGYKKVEKTKEDELIKSGKINNAINDCRKGVVVAFPVLERLTIEDRKKYGITDAEFTTWKFWYKFSLGTNIEED